MKYKLSYLPVAKQDLQETIIYIAAELHAPKAAADLLDALEQGLTRLCDFPYSCQVYLPVKPLEREYRMLTVNNYAVFYVVDEEQKTVEIRRVVYGKMDLNKLLK